MKNLSEIILLTTLLLTAGLAFGQQTARAQGFEYYSGREYQKAIESLQKTVAADEKDAEAWRFLGMALARTKKVKEAREAFKSSTKAAAAKPGRTIDDKPVRIIAKRPPRYPETAMRSMATGKVRFAVEFAKDGEIGFVFPLNDLADELIESAVEAAYQIKFEPAVRNGRPVTSIKFIEYEFGMR